MTVGQVMVGLLAALRTLASYSMQMQTATCHE